MAIAARFSNHPSIKTEPSYWAGEKFATKATSLIDSSTLEPSIPNLQFWGIMSCLEYGRASGSKAWIYSGIAVRMCHDLGLNKEATLRTPIYTFDGPVDQVEMALRRRVFWSCLCIDIFASASTNHPQGFGIGEYDVQPPSVRDAQILLDPLHGFTLDRIIIDTDPLIDFLTYYLRIIERFGEICKYMSKAKTDSTAVNWPPIPEFTQLHRLTEQWYKEVPEKYKFTPANLAQYREKSSQNYLNFWLCAYGMYCTGMLALHRGSLTYCDLTMNDMPRATYERIQLSIRICKENVDLATKVFKSIREICGENLLPYMGYSAYIFATVLMTSAFSSDPMSYTKSSTSLANLYELIDMLRPSWPMSERLAITTRDLLSAHSRLYKDPHEPNYSDSILPTQQQQLNVSDNATAITTSSYPPFVIQSNPYSITTEPQTQQPLTMMPNTYPTTSFQQQQLPHFSNDINFNSSEFLYDSALFGQIIFDNNNDPNLFVNTSNNNKQTDLMYH